jgi:hypothetical protein
MGSTDTISVAALAVHWKIPVDKLMPYVEQGYLRQVSTDGTPLGTFVYKPLPEFEDWLRSLLGPLSMRVLMPVSDLCKLLTMKTKIFTNLCFLFKIPLHSDPVFGDMMSAKDYYRFLVHYDRFRGFIHTDRQTFVSVLARLRGKKIRIWDLARFSQLLEDEIQRISRLDEPQRTVAATALWCNYTEAAKFTAVLPQDREMKGRSTKLARNIGNKLYGVKMAIEGKDTWENRHDYSGSRFVPGIGWIAKDKHREATSARHAREKAERLNAATAEQAGEPSSAS